MALDSDSAVLVRQWQLRKPAEQLHDLLKGCGKTDNGRYAYSNHDELMAYADFMAMFNKSWNKISLNAVLGTSINYTKSNTLSMDSHLAGLYHPNVFTPTNINYGNMSSGDGSASFNAKNEMQSVFATAQIGYADAVYLDLTADRKSVV